MFTWLGYYESWLQSLALFLGVRVPPTFSFIFALQKPIGDFTVPVHKWLQIQKQVLFNLHRSDSFNLRGTPGFRFCIQSSITMIVIKHYFKSPC